MLKTFKLIFSKINKLIFIVFLLTIITFLITSIIRIQLPLPEDIVQDSYNQPFQTELTEDQKPFTIKTDDEKEYLITPVFQYEINALVVSENNSQNPLDIVHKMWGDTLNIKDLCMVYGENLKTNIYKKISFSNGSFSCRFEGPMEYFSKFNLSEVSNNHLITNNPEILSKLEKIKIGDQVKLKGYLATYSTEGFYRGTSTSREDMGDGACETIYLTNVEILKENLPQFSNIFNISKSLLSLESILLILSLIINAYLSTK